MTRIWSGLARIPVPVVAVLLVVGGALIPVHEMAVAHMHEPGNQEWPQWVGRLTLQWYWALLPLAVLALWARRRAVQGRIGRVGAWLNLLGGPLEYALITVGALVRGVLGRGDLPPGFMALEWLGYLIMPGIVLAGVAMLRDRGLPRWQGLLVVLLAPAAWLPFGAFVVGAALGVALVVGTRRPAVLDSPAPATAR
ncbi:hypothetical protein [Geodermatophilus sp. SYSU D00815]